MVKLTGFQKAAIVLITLGADLSAKVLKYFPDDDIEQLSKQISLTERVPESVQNTVIHEFMKLIEAREYLLRGGHKYAKELLEKALGPQRAEEILNKVSVSIHSTLFGSLRRVDAKQLIGFIKDEHPQTIALILTYLIPEQAALILSSLPPEKQSDIARRVATMERISPEVVKEVERVLEKKLSVVDQQDKAAGGIKSLVVDSHFS